MTPNIRNRQNKFVLFVLQLSTYQGDLIQYKNFRVFQKNFEKDTSKIFNVQKN